VAAAAARYVGLEHDAGMLGLAERARAGLPPEVQARAHLVRADMRDFALRERFDRIFVPHSGLWCLQSDADVERCLERVVSHLAPGGKLVLDAYHADPFHEHSRPDDVADDYEELVADVQHAGVHYDVLERSTWDRDGQRMDVIYRHVPRDSVASGSAPEGAIAHHYLLCDQLATKLVNAGLTDLFFSGDFEGHPITDEHDLLVVTAGRGDA
jgi:SAM-dependent methyltransferase